MSQSYDSFKKFYDENKHKIQMPLIDNYPINYNKAKYWADSQCDKESREFANDIISFTQYISFPEFMNRLKKVCVSYKKTYSKIEHKDTKFILILPFKLIKSNMWVSLLAFEFLKDIIDDVYYNVTSVYNETIDPKSNLYNKTVRCIMCDDCSYTGSQLESISKFNTSIINYPNKPSPPSVYSTTWLEWYKNVNTEANTYIKKISIAKFSVDLVIPYMSILAQTKLKSIHYIKIPDDCLVFPIFSQMVNLSKIATPILNEFRSTFQYHNDISAIYFDHKIADTLSTFHKIYLLAPLFNCSVNNLSVGFIENCDTTTPDNINIYDNYMDLGDILGDKVCPPSYYKHIKYTFNNKFINTDLYMFEFLD
jgi:hypothetical protein